MSRPRTGSLIWRRKGWGARLSFSADSGRVQRIVDLHTTSRSLAERKLAALLSSGEMSDELRQTARRRETFGEAARRLVEAQGAEGMKTWTERLYRLNEFAIPFIGKLDPAEIKPSHIQEVYRNMVRRELSRRTIMHMKADLSRIFADAIREELCSDNPVGKTSVPSNAIVDNRERIVLTDEEFAQFMACESVPAELHVMAMCSRTLGGMRTSDLHAWAWDHIDTENWIDAHVPRPKVGKSGRRQPRLTLPEMLLPILQSWWHSQGRPRTGAVFPAARGPRAGGHKKRMSYAEQLREALWLAGVVRPLPGFREAKSEAEQKARCLIQSGNSLEYKPLDFHSFRRAFATGLAAAGVSTPLAMALADHRDASTHTRYTLLGQRSSLTVPEHALPRGLSRRALNQDFGPTKTLMNSARPERFELPTFGSVGRPKELIEHDSSHFDEVVEVHETSGIEVSAQTHLLNDPVEQALAYALTQATQAQQWDTVAQLARELQARRQASDNVVSLDSVRAGKGRSK